MIVHCLENRKINTVGLVDCGESKDEKIKNLSLSFALIQFECL